MTEIAQNVDVRTVIEHIVENQNLSGDLWLDDGEYEEFEYFQINHENIEKIDENEWFIPGTLDTQLWFHEKGGMDIHIGDDSYAKERMGESREVESGDLMIFVTIENGEIVESEGEIILDAPNAEMVSGSHPSDYHDEWDYEIKH